MTRTLTLLALAALAGWCAAQLYTVHGLMRVAASPGVGGVEGPGSRVYQGGVWRDVDDSHTGEWARG